MILIISLELLSKISIGNINKKYLDQTKDTLITNTLIKSSVVNICTSKEQFKITELKKHIDNINLDELYSDIKLSNRLNKESSINLKITQRIYTKFYKKSELFLHEIIFKTHNTKAKSDLNIKICQSNNNNTINLYDYIERHYDKEYEFMNNGNIINNPELYNAHNYNKIQIIEKNKYCRDTIRLEINLYKNPSLKIIKEKSEIYPNHIVLKAVSGNNNNNIRYRWNDGLECSTRPINKTGSYRLCVTDNNGCMATEEVDVDNIDKNIIVPNAFSPNNDGSNDKFSASCKEDLKKEDYSIIIYNRWGTVESEFKLSEEGWNGKKNGKPSQSGLYIWILTHNNKVIDKGSLSLVR
jgi:gliding motility-associated-like protein